MNTLLTKRKTFSFTTAVAIAGLLALSLSGSGWLMAENDHSGFFEDETDRTLASNKGIHEEDVDWTLARTEAEEDQTDWTLAKREVVQEEEVDWTLAKRDNEEDKTDWTLA